MTKTGVIASPFSMYGFAFSLLTDLAKYSIQANVSITFTGVTSGSLVLPSGRADPLLSVGAEHAPRDSL